MTARERRRAQRFEQAVEAQLAEIESLRREALRAQRALDDYLDDRDWPERRETFETFEGAGGETSQQWAAWVKGAWPRAARRRIRLRPRLVWVNPRPPEGEEKEKR